MHEYSNSNHLFLVLEFSFKGSNAFDHTDVYYAISDQDHPVSALMHSPKKIARGTSTTVGLSVREVCIYLHSRGKQSDQIKRWFYRQTEQP